MESKMHSCFTTVPGFCPDCGSVLPLLDKKKITVICFTCRREWSSESMYSKQDTQVSIIKKKYVT